MTGVEVVGRKIGGEGVVVDTMYGTSAEELARVIESGPPYLVRFTWAGGRDPREQAIVNEAIAACFGVKSLEPTQTIREFEGSREAIPDRIRYVFWLLRAFDLSLGFSHGWDAARGSADSPPQPGSARPTKGVYKITIRVDRARRREYY
ncbi:MAG TPA: hypothetical protein VI198_06665, partial [Candidatus Eisenbacteria bacterium]